VYFQHSRVLSSCSSQIRSAKPERDQSSAFRRRATSSPTAADSFPCTEILGEILLVQSPYCILYNRDILGSKGLPSKGSRRASRRSSQRSFSRSRCFLC